MKKEELKELASKAKEIGIAIYGTDGYEDFDAVCIDVEGDIEVQFSYYDYDGIREVTTIYLTEQDITDPIEETVFRHRKKKQEEEDRKIEEELKRELELKKEQEKSERELYKKLKEKYEKH